ncbi:uncharacterized protein EDB91DRAFT_1164966 [Suillus paluster]|uniref:uncharacterized protein n=1 Tax=Suillus paluster TaxID=48578 RepID=UPI001B872D8D|nr:uncharacterized protein EDB91DRAFT_1164966 [Suillus paluster]KAG1727073.1 hypothetical protein EDB91DRAFT_1164966 [Suillus paluster]
MIEVGVHKRGGGGSCASTSPLACEVGGLIITSQVLKHSEATPFSVHHTHTFPQSSAIVNFAWYPGASSSNAPAFCFVASVRDCPVKLLDASDARLRASHPIVDHGERFIAPHNLVFNLTADKLYCGFEDAIEIFDIQHPGEGDRLPTIPSEKSIISTMYKIVLYSEPNKVAIMPIGGTNAQSGLNFHPTKPHILYAAFRRHDEICAWDLRSDTSIPVQVLRTSPDSWTNQKIEFDIDCTGRWLSVGDQNGHISMFDLGDSDELDSEQLSEMSPQNMTPKLTFSTHRGQCGGLHGFSAPAF